MSTNFNDLIMSQSVTAQVEAIVKKQPHAILIDGEDGCGKFYLARYLSERLGVKKANLLIYGDSGEDSSLSIELAKQLKNINRHKRAGSEDLRAIIIVDAHRLTTEAQNALLKLIEEPPMGVFFLLTSSVSSHILPTIKSRTTKLGVTPPSFEAVKEVALKLHTDSAGKLDTLWLAARQRCGTLFKMLDDPKLLDETLKSLSDSKKAFAGNTYDFAVNLLSHSTNKASLAAEIENLILISELALERAQTVAQYEQLSSKLESLIDCYDNINRNAQVKLQIDLLASKW